MSIGTFGLNETTTWRSAGRYISADTMFVARVPIYGTFDAGRGFWKKLRHDILRTGLKENAVIRALYIYQEDGEPKSMLSTDVDDLRRWATRPGYEDRVQQLLDRYTTKTVESGTFRSCGREVTQHSDFRSQSSAKTRPRRLNLCVMTLRGVSKQISLVTTRSLSAGRWSDLQPGLQGNAGLSFHTV